MQFDYSTIVILSFMRTYLFAFLEQGTPNIFLEVKN